MRVARSQDPDFEEVIVVIGVKFQVLHFGLMFFFFSARPFPVTKLSHRSQSAKLSSVPGSISSRSRMRRTILFTFTVFLLGSLNGLGQSSPSSAIITTYVGPPLPLNGAPAVTQAFDGITSVSSDGIGGFYVAYAHQNRECLGRADGLLDL